PRGFEPDLEAVLVVEVDGNDQEFVEADLMRMVDVLDGVDNRIAQSPAERDRLWEARRRWGEVVRSTPHNYFAEDVAVPIGAIPEVLRRVRRLSEETGIKICTVGHSGDGNLHPSLVFTDEQRPLVSRAASRIFRDALELGGSISAEHGLGALKRDHAELEHGPLAISLMRGLKDLMDPEGILNPHKVLPEGPADDGFLDRQPGWYPDPRRPRRKAETGL